MKTKADFNFESSYKELNKEQKLAVDTIEGPVMVMAGPGTGKTTVLTLRIANILRKSDTEPENILALTFTESGAINMQRKLSDIIGPLAYRVNIHTFHGFAEKVISEYPEYFDRHVGSSVAKETEKVSIIKEIINRKKIKILRPYGDPNYYISTILREIQSLKRENISPKLFLQEIKNGYNTDNDSRVEKIKAKKNYAKNLELAYIYEQYEKALRKQKIYDFEDMLIFLIDALERDQDFKLILQEKYQYILADEHQDANNAQNKILELLSDFFDAPNLFVVGDHKQAIYRFQGASPANFKAFASRYRDVKTIDLRHNYRSHQGILDASFSLIKNNIQEKERESHRLLSLQMGSSPILVTECESINEELEVVAHSIEAILKKNEDKEVSIAVLYRDNKQALPLSEILKAHGIEHKVESNNDLFAEPDVVKLINLCRAIHDPGNEEYIAKALFIEDLEINPIELSKIFLEARKTGLPIQNVIEKPGISKDIKRVYEAILLWSKEARVKHFPTFLKEFIQEIDLFASILPKLDAKERFLAVQEFFDKISSISDKEFYIEEFIDYIDTVKEHGIKEKRNKFETNVETRLMTCHHSKGLEFDHVFIINFNDHIWGNRKNRNLFDIPALDSARDTGKIEDERRLFFVALTRGRESVHITYARSDGEKSLLPSQFLSEIDSKLIDFEYVDSSKEEIRVTPVFRSSEKDQEISLLDNNFVREMFLSQQLSVTHINNYFTCSWQYFFVNLLRLPQTENKFQLYGTAIHAALDYYGKNVKSSKKVSPSTVIKVFKDKVKSFPIEKRLIEELQKKGEKALKGYISIRPILSKKFDTEYSLRNIMLNIKSQDISIPLSGKFDRIEYLENDVVKVFDFKTGQRKTRNEILGKTKNADKNYIRQLTFYKLLLSLHGKYSMKSGIIDFIEPDEKGRYYMEEFEIDNDMSASLIAEISQMLRELSDGTFKDKGCKEKDCEYCRLGNMLRESTIISRSRKEGNQ